MGGILRGGINIWWLMGGHEPYQNCGQWVAKSFVSCYGMSSKKVVGRVAKNLLSFRELHMTCKFSVRGA